MVPEHTPPRTHNRGLAHPNEPEPEPPDPVNQDEAVPVPRSPLLPRRLQEETELQREVPTQQPQRETTFDLDSNFCRSTRERKKPTVTTYDKLGHQGQVSVSFSLLIKCVISRTIMAIPLTMDPFVVAFASLDWDVSEGSIPCIL